MREDRGDATAAHAHAQVSELGVRGLPGGSARDGAACIRTGRVQRRAGCEVYAIAFGKYGRDGQAKTQAMGDLMRDLGADWDAEEEKEKARAEDPARVEPCVRSMLTDGG